MSTETENLSREIQMIFKKSQMEILDLKKPAILNEKIK